MAKRTSRPRKSSSPAQTTVIGIQLTSGQAQSLKEAAVLKGVTRNEFMRVTALARATQLRNMAKTGVRPHVEELARIAIDGIFDAVLDDAKRKAEKSGLPLAQDAQDYDGTRLEYEENLVSDRIKDIVAAAKACGPELIKLIGEGLKKKTKRRSSELTYEWPEELE